MDTARHHPPSDTTMYCIVRRDLTLAQQLVQLAHAAAEAGRRFYRDEHGTARLVALQVANRQALTEASQHLSLRGIAHAVFHEPDHDIGPSALATEPLPPSQRRHLRRFALWVDEDGAALTPVRIQGGAGAVPRTASADPRSRTDTCGTGAQGALPPLRATCGRP